MFCLCFFSLFGDVYLFLHSFLFFPESKHYLEIVFVAVVFRPMPLLLLLLLLLPPPPLAYRSIPTSYPLQRSGDVSSSTDRF